MLFNIEVLLFKLGYFTAGSNIEVLLEIFYFCLNINLKYVSFHFNKLCFLV